MLFSFISNYLVIDNHKIIKRKNKPYLINDIAYYVLKSISLYQKILIYNELKNTIKKNHD